MSKLGVCRWPVYHFEGWTFDLHPRLGAWPMKKNGRPYKRKSKAFGESLGRFFALDEDERMDCLIMDGYCELRSDGMILVKGAVKGK